MEARLSRGKLAEAYVADADLGGADLTDAILTDADLTRAKLTGANLKNVRGLKPEQLSDTQRVVAGNVPATAQLEALEVSGT